MLTHPPCEPIAIEGGTAFHFVEDILDALDQPFAAAGGLVDAAALGYTCVGTGTTPTVTHARFARSSSQT